MKGFTKAIKRTPHMMTSKVGISKKSTDPEFDDYQRKFTILESATEKFLKDTRTYTEAVNSLFTSGNSFAQHFATLFHPIQSEYDVLGKFPEAAHTVKNVDAYQGTLEELHGTIAPELELIESRVVGPVKELQAVLKTIRKMITKREHKLIDFDRHNNALSKLRDKKEKTLNDEKNLFKLEQDFEIASNEYDYINTAMKQDLPRFMVLATRFIDPLFHSFFYMQLNIYYMLLEKMNMFADGKYDVAVPAAQIATDFEARRGETQQTVESLAICQKFVSTSKLVQQHRGLTPGAPVGRSPSAASSASRTTTGSDTFSKKMPPPPPSASSFKSSYSSSYSSPPSSAAPPPPYVSSAEGTSAAAAAATKRAPPPPPALKPKPKPAVQYVVALYDFAAQADGDLDFKTGDRIEVVERTGNTEDWWTGRLNGQTGVFPGKSISCPRCRLGVRC
ncbi:hypothetical protein OF83DRAFT_1052026 [Amylostereum chailletii]|nr:hypothetical protein OF83DRAFT_1052026 [Amylostereum chailletii]